jgi:hypothetical protein
MTMRQSTPLRQHKRMSYPLELTVEYEGKQGTLHTLGPVISARGMFIETGDVFPYSAILKVRFRLPESGFPVAARCEVRYCLPGVGVGVEFIDLAPEIGWAIEMQVEKSSAQTLG